MSVQPRVAGQRRAEALEQSVHERAGQAAAARVDLIAAPLLHRGREHSRDGNTRQLERIDERREVIGRVDVSLRIFDFRKNRV